MMILLQDGHEPKRCKGPTDIQICEPSVRSTKDARVVATDEEDSVALPMRYTKRRRTGDPYCAYAIELKK